MTMIQLFSYRIIETTYKNYIAYDEGPGSATSVDATTSKRVLEKHSKAPESWAKSLLQEGDYHLQMQSSSADGRYDYSYTLERADIGATNWRYQGHIPRYAHVDCYHCGDLLPYPGADCRRCQDYT